MVYYLQKLLVKELRNVVILEWLKALSLKEIAVNVLDIFLVWILIYKLISITKGTRAMQLIRGIFLIFIFRIISQLIGLETLTWLFNQVMTWGVLGIIIIFQPELRRALEQLGRGTLLNIFFTKRSVDERSEEIAQSIEAIIEAMMYMSKRHIGALISIERNTGLREFTEQAIEVDAKISKALLINLFIPNTPLHDGAVIIQNNRVAYGAAYFPLSDNPYISKELGTRHRASLGISEITDAITLIVSEETGAISMTLGGKLYRHLEEEKLRELLRANWLDETTFQIKTLFTKGGVNDGK